MGINKSTVTDEFFRVKIDLPSVQIDIASKEPRLALPEFRRVLEAMKLDEQMIYEEFVQEELRQSLSKHFVENPDVMRAIKKLLKQEEDYRVFKTEIPSKAEIDLEQNIKSIAVNQLDVKRQINSLTEQFDAKTVKQGMIHITGKIQHDDKLLIVDHIHQHMPTAQLRAFHTNGEQDQVLVECIFFGEFPEEEL